MHKERCIVIPALKKHAVIPDQLVKKMNGITLIQRAIDTALELEDAPNVHVVTDSQEIALIAERNKVQCHLDPKLRFASNDLTRELKFFILKRSKEFGSIIILRPGCPLLTSSRIEEAYDQFTSQAPDVLITLKKEEHRLWKDNDGKLSTMIFDESKEPVYVESRAFIIMRSNILERGEEDLKVMPFLLQEEAVEVASYQDWWILEKLLARKRIVFVVAGNSQIGMGHIYRALTIAHEIHDHQIIFLCTEESELAATHIAEKEYRTIVQKNELSDEVMALRPDLVINDVLNTDRSYVDALMAAGIKVVNFEDLGTGASRADMTINELYDVPTMNGESIYWGSQYLFLRDEFTDAKPRTFQDNVGRVLVTFGGTDPAELTMLTLESIRAYCDQNGIGITVVTGSGYVHVDRLQEFIKHYPDIEWISATGTMSSTMERCDLAISSNGRTVYELAHMNIPSIIVAQHEREKTHGFSTQNNGFVNLGLEHDGDRLLSEFKKLVENKAERKALYDKMLSHDFIQNKKKVIDMVLDLLTSA